MVVTALCVLAAIGLLVSFVPGLRMWLGHRRAARTVRV
jgi:hypothetical protein